MRWTRSGAALVLTAFLSIAATACLTTASRASGVADTNPNMKPDATVGPNESANPNWRIGNYDAVQSEPPAERRGIKPPGDRGRIPFNIKTRQVAPLRGSEYSRSVLVDASDDGGVWWFPEPQAMEFDATIDHQGKPLADLMRKRGWFVVEVGRHGKIRYEEFAGYDLVIRAGACHDTQCYGFDDGTNAYEPRMYESFELDAYKRFVSEGGKVLLLGRETEVSKESNEKADPLLDALGWQNASQWTLGKGMVTLVTEAPLDIITAREPRTSELLDKIVEGKQLPPEGVDTGTMPPPELLAPNEGEQLPQGENAIWRFKWRGAPQCAEERWQLIVIHRHAMNPLLDVTVESTSYDFQFGSGEIVERNLNGWTWKVRGLCGDGRTSKWSEPRTFAVEPSKEK
jgi:hypothetical protein